MEIGSVKPIPDLSIEVVFTSGGISKLERYKVLGVPEVQFWEDGLLKLYHLEDDSYEPIERSLLPGLSELDLDLLRRCILMAETDAGEAIRAFRREIQRNLKPGILAEALSMTIGQLSQVKFYYEYLSKGL